MINSSDKIIGEAVELNHGTGGWYQISAADSDHFACAEVRRAERSTRAAKPGGCARLPPRFGRSAQ